MSDTSWTWVHAKVLTLAADEATLEDLLPEHRYVGFDPPSSDRRIRASDKDETLRALLDLVAVQAVAVYRCESVDDGHWVQVPDESIAELLADQSSWETRTIELAEGPLCAEAWTILKGIEYFDERV